MKTQVLGMILLVGVLAFVSCQKEEDNTIPIPALLVDPPEGTVSTTFTFDASQSYDDQDPASMLEVRWDWDADGRWDTEWTTEKVAEFNFASCCDHPVKMEIRDSEGWSNITRATVKVYSDSVAPVAFFIPQPRVAKVGQIIKLNASQSIEKSIGSKHLQFRWDLNEDGVWDTPYSTEAIKQHSYSTIGTKHVTLEVINSIGITCCSTEELTIIP